MTTIIASLPERCMLSDTAVTVGEARIPSEKIARVGDMLIGTAGLAASCEKFIEWMSSGKGGKRPKRLDEFEALVLHRDALYFYDNKLACTKVMTGVHAIGSGGKAALAAHLAGAALKKAVEIACIVDAYSALPVKKEQL